MGFTEAIGLIVILLIQLIFILGLIVFALSLYAFIFQGKSVAEIRNDLRNSVTRIRKGTY